MSRSPIERFGQVARTVRAWWPAGSQVVATLCVDESPSTGPITDWSSWLSSATAGMDRLSRLDLVVGPTIAPVIGVSGGQASLSRADWLRVAQHRFAQMLDGRTDDFQVAVDGYGGRERLACAMPRQLVNAVQELSGARNVRYLSLQPALVAAVNAASRLSAFNDQGWIVTVTRRSLHAAFMDAGGIRVAAPFARDLGLDSQQQSQTQGGQGVPATPAFTTHSAFLAREACLLGLPAPTGGTWVECEGGGEGEVGSDRSDLPTGFSVVRLGTGNRRPRFASAAAPRAIAGA